ncbi:MAG: chemotaxis protein CheD [Burkholderiales bacterium]|nr:chemotaxis protein CheD [Burkholderiales bacterium]
MSALPQPGATHTLHPGDVACADRGERLETLLGSCVAIVLTDPRRTVGVMCHVVHSRPSNSPPPPERRPEAADGEAALRAMYARLRARAIVPALCQAWLYGGGNMFPALVTERHVGDDNAAWALAALARDGVRVLGQDLGGPHYRRLAWTVGPWAPEVTVVAV